MGVLLFLALQTDEPEGYFSPHHLTCPAVCSVTDKPSGFALSLVPADGTVVLMGHTGVLEATQGCAGEVLVTLSGLQNAREKCEEWMSQNHPEKTKTKERQHS